MAANFISADYGWLCSPNRQESAHILFKPGKNQDGYFTYKEILAHARMAMSILKKHYPHECHIFIFDNASTHLKCAVDTLSAYHMSKNPTGPNNPMFGVNMNMLNEQQKLVYGPDGKVLRTQIQMEVARLPNGEPQSLYFESGPQMGVFKRMAHILKKHRQL